MIGSRCPRRGYNSAPPPTAKQPNNFPLNLKENDEPQTEEQRWKTKQGSESWALSWPTRLLWVFLLVLSSLAEGRTCRKKGWSIMDCEVPLGETVGLWVVDKTGLWQPYSGPSSIINQREGGHFQEDSSSEEPLPQDITHEKILQLLIHLKHSASHSPSVGILCLHAHTRVWHL